MRIFLNKIGVKCNKSNEVEKIVVIFDELILKNIFKIKY